MEYDGDQVLDERILRQGVVHWLVFVGPLVLVLVSVWLATTGWAKLQIHDRTLPLNYPLAFVVVGVLLFFSSFAATVRGLITWSTTELTLTSSGIIARHGLLHRDSTEMPFAQVEGITVRQGLLGMLFGFGTVEIAGTGSTVVPVPGIMDPEGFRRAAIEQLEGHGQLAEPRGD